VVGYTTEMDEYMAAADLLVGKPGGLTSSEALARGLALVIVRPIPGQEERNADHLLEAGAAIRCNNLPPLPGRSAARRCEAVGGHAGERLPTGSAARSTRDRDCTRRHSARLSPTRHLDRSEAGWFVMSGARDTPAPETKGPDGLWNERFHGNYPRAPRAAGDDGHVVSAALARVSAATMP
jgi:Glycosyltransferase family 28 C-terminal domain